VYVGGHFGAAWGQSDWTANGAGGLLSDNGSLGLGNPFEFSPGTGSYFQGLQAGYNYELPSGVVLGAQADLSFPNLLAGTQTIAVAGIDIANYEQQVLFSGTLRGRLGYAFGPLLVYGTGGTHWRRTRSRGHKLRAWPSAARQRRGPRRLVARFGAAGSLAPASRPRSEATGVPTSNIFSPTSAPTA
jgi:high affinity Mn2+ porin